MSAHTTCVMCRKPLGHSDRAMKCARCKECRLREPGRIPNLGNRKKKAVSQKPAYDLRREKKPEPVTESWWLGLTPTEFATAAKGRASR